MSSTLLIERQGAVETWTMNDPATRNALSDAVFVIEEPVAYVTSGLHVNQAYRCSLRDRPDTVEVFDESDLAPTSGKDEVPGLRQ